MTAEKGKLIVISGPAGCGKDSIIEGLLEKAKKPDLMSGKLVYSVSTTTRAIRPGETEGKHYYFKSREEFERLIALDEFIEYTEYCGNYYGTRKKTVMNALKNGERILLKIECEGAENIKSLFPDALLIFIMPPSFEELRTRLEARDTEDARTIQKRMIRAKEEMICADSFDFQVVNDDLQEAIDEVARIICS
ncbi:MAG: guanylate kinase [Oscillospiraceae bacterium]|nr:guanylate kinase [Oscillospiraceae bacterium]